MSKCSGCTWFQKLKNDQFGGGLCDLLDRRTKSDCGCELWQGIKYDRNKQKQKDKNHE